MDQREKDPRRVMQGPPGEMLLAHTRAGQHLGKIIGQVNGNKDKGAGDNAITLLEERRKRKRRKQKQEFISGGGIVREVDLSKEPKVAEVLASLYLQDSVIEHLANVSPFTTDEDIDKYYEKYPLPSDESRKPPTNPREIRNYYKKNTAKLLVAEINGEIVGAATVARTPDLSEAKINRLVTKDTPETRRKGIANLLVREGLVRAFSAPEQGGYGVSAVVVAIILGVKGFEAPINVFREFGFGSPTFWIRRCLGWDREEGQYVKRDVQQMSIQKESSDAKRWVNDYSIGTSFPQNRVKPSA